MQVFKVSSSGTTRHIRWIIKQKLGLDPPQALINEFINNLPESEIELEKLVFPSKIPTLFCKLYINPKVFDGDDKTSCKPIKKKLALSDYQIADHENPSPGDGRKQISALTGHLEVQGQDFWTQGIGDGPMDCLIELLSSIGLVMQLLEHQVAIVEYRPPDQLKEDTSSSEGMMVAYVKCSDISSYTAWGIGIDENPVDASLKALIRAVTSLMPA
ncbi:2-isopropylmalate synthase [Penicillium angulare]|uniref:2-isopropylmalate synthase n=1 Tax=Penicillium angulare TaxID=116970 RepID=A0A9W9K940_9EURO|nr:2-isopropylmalate synthase [Penicillium angulare]